MKDEELRKLMEHTDMELNSFYGKWMAHFLEAKSTENPAIFTGTEETAWKENEPNFTKRIVTPLNSKRPPDKLPV